jgi:hypothetical protein
VHCHRNFLNQAAAYRKLAAEHAKRLSQPQPPEKTE